MHPDLKQAIKDSASIPSVPMVASRFMEMTADENCEYDDVVELLSTDAGVVSEILRLVNSALYGVRRQISSLRQAITLLGLARVRTLLLSRFLVEQMDGMSFHMLNPNHYWRRSVTSGALNTHFCKTAQVAQSDVAFLSGLLCDVGVVILSNALGDEYATIAREYQPLHSHKWVERERHQLGESHAEISAMVLEDWNLPADIVEAVRHHHDEFNPNEALTTGMELAKITQAANHISQVLCDPPAVEIGVQRCLETLETAGLSGAVLLDALPDLEQEIADLSHLLKVKTLDGDNCDLLSQRLHEQLSSDA